jgi:sulfur-carrier protein
MIPTTPSTSTSPTTVQITVKLFAVYQEAYNQSELVLELPTGATAADLQDRLIQEHPRLAQWRSVTRFGINLQFAPPDTRLETGDEVVLIPPVSGG